MDRTVLAILALTGAQYQHTRQRCCCTGHVDDTRARIVRVANAIQPAAAPGPVARHRVDEGGHDHREGQEGPQLHTLGHGTRHDRHRRCDEHDLEEEVRTHGVVRCIFTTGQHRIDAVLGTDQEPKARQETAFAAGVHDVVAHQQVHGAGNGKQRNVLGQNFSGVLGTYHTGLEHREAGGHPHDQYAANQEVKRIERIAQFCKLVHQVFPVIQEKLYVVGRRCVGRPRTRRRHALRYEYE